MGQLVSSKASWSCSSFYSGICLSFLQDLLDSGYLYRTLNVYRSAISSTHVYVYRRAIPLGQHHLVKRFFKGVLNLRPPQPRYSSTWHVTTVLNFLKSLPDNRRLSIRQLTLKLTMLFALVSASRCSSFTAIDINHMSRSSNGTFVFRLMKPSKCVSVKKPFHVIEICRFKGNRNLCPVRTLEEYLDRTSHLRESSNSSMSQLLLSYANKPYHPVVSSTVARWLKTILKEAGIDTSIFKAHSTRGASTSAAAYAGVTIKFMTSWKRQTGHLQPLSPASTTEDQLSRILAKRFWLRLWSIQGESLRSWRNIIPQLCKVLTCNIIGII